MHKYNDKLWALSSTSISTNAEIVLETNLVRALRASMEYFDDFEKCQKEEMSEEGSAVDQM